MERWRRGVYKLLEVEPDDRGIEKAFNVGLLTLILLNVIAVILETVAALHERFALYFGAFEVFSVAVFTVEYLLRVWSCTVNPRFSGLGPVSGRIRFVLTPMALVDLVAILPSLILGGMLDLRFLRVVRLFRLMWSLKIARHALQTLGTVLQAKKEEMLITGVVGLVLLVFASSAMYYVEHAAQPQVFSSIPAAMWWGVVTLTTVGYGDIYPVTPVGKVLGGFIAILGVGLFALPTGILAAGFSEEIQRRRRSKKTCPHCGHELD